jgi:hypothetical protein
MRHTEGLQPGTSNTGMPNKIGKLEEPTDIMKEGEINIFGLSRAKDSKEGRN